MFTIGFDERLKGIVYFQITPNDNVHERVVLNINHVYLIKCFSTGDINKILSQNTVGSCPSVSALPVDFVFYACKKASFPFKTNTKQKGLVSA